MFAKHNTTERFTQ